MIVNSVSRICDTRYNLDLTSVRLFVAVADVGGVTRAAGYPNLTQSSVSMQIKRLEEAFGLQLFLRAARKLALSSESELLLSCGRRMLALNDKALSRGTATACACEIRPGVPHDVACPTIPGILGRMAQAYPSLRINLVSSFTQQMKHAFGRGGFDVFLTTEGAPDAGAEVLGLRPPPSGWMRQIGGRGSNGPFGLASRIPACFGPAPGRRWMRRA